MRDLERKLERPKHFEFEPVKFLDADVTDERPLRIWTDGLVEELVGDHHGGEQHPLYVEACQGRQTMVPAVLEPLQVDEGNDAEGRGALGVEEYALEVL